MMNNLLKLPKVSNAFLTHIEGHALEKNEWMPCPRCGEGTVTPPVGGALGTVAGVGLIGCWLWILGIGAIILAIIFWPIAVAFIILGLILIPLLPVIGAAIGMMYNCKSCSFAWSFRDVEDYKKVRNTRNVQ